MNGYFSTFFTTYNCLTSFDKLGVRHIIRYSMFSFFNSCIKICNSPFMDEVRSLAQEIVLDVCTTITYNENQHVVGNTLQLWFCSVCRQTLAYVFATTIQFCSNLLLFLCTFE